MPGGTAPVATAPPDGLASADRVLLGVSDLGVRFGGVVALDGISFEIRAGCNFASNNCQLFAKPYCFLKTLCAKGLGPG